MVGGSENGSSLSVSGVRLSNCVELLFRECKGLVLAFFGIVNFLGDSGLSLNGILDLLFAASFASLVLLNRTLPRFACIAIASTPGLPGLLGGALESALDCSSM